MSEYQILLNSIAETTADYRGGVVTPEHIQRWIEQFDLDVQLPILREMDYVLKKTYFSLEKITKFLTDLINTEEIAGSNPSKFWTTVHFLNIQIGGNSQREMLELFNKILKQAYGVEINTCQTTAKEFIYLDDAIFTGNRVFRDIEAWIKSGNSPLNCKIHVVTIASHNGSREYAHGRIESVAKEAGKKIDIDWWGEIELENRRNHTNSSDVLRPISIPNVLEVQQYVSQMNYKPTLRKPNGNNQIFSNEYGRHLLEQEFLKAGVEIRCKCPYLTAVQRPLGHISLETLGFGSLIVTFRNCPNNAPLALWAGNPWHPLFPRITNTPNSTFQLD